MKPDLVENCNYIIPQWIAGRYNKPAHIAIMYNTLCGEAFYFDEDSADVIGTILNYNRGDQVDIELVANIHNIATSSIIDFFEELIPNYLLVNKVLTDSEIQVLRHNIFESRRNVLSSTKEVSLPTYFDTVENDYRKIVTEQGIPMSVMFELTYNCNEKCIHCYNPGAARGNGEQSHRETEELDLVAYYHLIDELYALGVVKLTLTGGDPFVKKEFWQILDYAYQKKFAIDIYTNGLALYQRDEVVRLLKFYPRSVGLSIYSALPEIHESITRVQGSLNKTIAVAKHLSDAGVALYFKCPIMTINAKSYHTVAALAAQYNAVPQFDVNLTSAMDGDVSIISHLRLDENTLNIVLHDPLQPLYVGMHAPNGGKKQLDLKEAMCGAGADMANITPFGEVYPCNSFPLPCGNLKNNSFADIWNNSIPLISVRKMVYEDCEQCGRNERCHFCNRCPGQSYIESKTPLKSSSDNCFTSNVRMNIAKDLNYMTGVCHVDVREELQKIELITSTDFSKEFKKGDALFPEVNTWQLLNNLI